MAQYCTLFLWEVGARERACVHQVFLSAHVHFSCDDVYLLILVLSMGLRPGVRCSAVEIGREGEQESVLGSILTNLNFLCSAFEAFVVFCHARFERCSRCKKNLLARLSPTVLG